jgi:thioredoxin 1
VSTVNLVEETFSATVHGNDMVLIDFWASWCGPCRTFGPVYERVSEDFPEIVFGKVDTDAEMGLAQGFRISSIPTLMAIRDGIVLYSQPGAIGEPQLRQLIAALQAIDMDEVRADIAEQTAQSEQAEAAN